MIIFEDVVNSELTQLEIKVQATSIGCLFSLLKISVEIVPLERNIYTTEREC